MTNGQRERFAQLQRVSSVLAADVRETRVAVSSVLLEAVALKRAQRAVLGEAERVRGRSEVAHAVERIIEDVSAAA